MQRTEALAILLNFYEYQASLGLLNYLGPLTDVSFFFWVPPAAHRQTLNCKQGPTTNRFLVSDATIPVLRGYRRRIWNECCAIATIHVTKWYAGFSSWRERNTCADELN